jgi:hypothetical protein
MTYSINDTTMMASDSTIDTITLTGASSSPTYTISNVSGTANVSSGIYWGINSGSPGQVLTSNGTSPGWANLSLADPDIKGSTLKVNGNADFDGEVTIKGKSLTDMFEKIEERLAILHPNPELEDKWDELKELGKRYKELEAEIIEKEKMWAILKK